MLWHFSPNLARPKVQAREGLGLARKVHYASHSPPAGYGRKLDSSRVSFTTSYAYQTTHRLDRSRPIRDRLQPRWVRGRHQRRSQSPELKPAMSHSCTSRTSRAIQRTTSTHSPRRTILPCALAHTTHSVTPPFQPIRSASQKAPTQTDPLKRWQP